MSAILIFSTADSMELAQKIASALVEAGDAACVNIIPGIRSIYRWEGIVCDEGEFLLLIKTVAERFDAVQRTIRTLHTYQVPEVVAVLINQGNPDYLDWLSTAAGGQRSALSDL
jgi:periplasmic divalent cation tolerance protein